MSEDIVLVQNLIHEIRGKKVMLDSDLARLYGVETRALKQAVRRNLGRFPSDFMFELTIEESNAISPRSQIVTLKETGRGLNTKYKPFVITEQGVDLLQLQQEENLEAVNDLSEDVRKDIDSLYLAIGQLAEKLEEKKRTPTPIIGFK